MSDELLPQSEIDDLLSAIGGDDAAESEAAEPQEEAAGPFIRIYDFIRPEIFTANSIRKVSVRLEGLLREAAGRMTALCGQTANLKLSSLDQLTAEEFIRSTPNPSLAAPLRAGKRPAGLLLLVPTAADTLWRLNLGLELNSGDPAQLLQSPPLIRALSRLCDALFGDPLSTLSGLRRGGAYQSDPALALEQDPLAPVLAAAVDMVLDESEITAALSLFLTEEAVALLTEEARHAGEAPADESRPADLSVDSALVYPLVTTREGLAKALKGEGLIETDPRTRGVMSYEERRSTE